MKRFIQTVPGSIKGKVKWIIFFTLIIICLGKLLSLLTGTVTEKPVTSETEISAVRIMQDRNDKLIAVIRSRELEQKRYDLLIDSLSRALKVKRKQITGADIYIIQTDTIVRENIRYEKGPDSVRFYKKDAYMELLAVGRDSGVSYFHLSTHDTLFRTQVRKSPLFKPSYAEVYLRSASPYNQITHGSSFILRSARPLLTIGPYAGYDLTSGRLSVGVSLQLPLVTIYSR